MSRMFLPRRSMLEMWASETNPASMSRKSFLASLRSLKEMAPDTLSLYTLGKSFGYHRNRQGGKIIWVKIGKMEVFFVLILGIG